MRSDLATHVDQLLDISSAAIAERRIQTAYYAVQAALSCARDLDDPARIFDVLRELETQNQLLQDETWASQLALEPESRKAMRSMYEAALHLAGITQDRHTRREESA